MRVAMRRRPAKERRASCKARARQGYPVYAKGAEPLCLSLVRTRFKAAVKKRKTESPSAPSLVWTSQDSAAIAAGRSPKAEIILFTPWPSCMSNESGKRYLPSLSRLQLCVNPMAGSAFVLARFLQRFPRLRVTEDARNREERAKFA